MVSIGLSRILQGSTAGSYCLLVGGSRFLQSTGMRRRCKMVQEILLGGSRIPTPKPRDLNTKPKTQSPKPGAELDCLFVFVRLRLNPVPV